MADITFEVLGPLSIHDGRGPITLRGPKRRALLAALLLRCGKTVAVRDLVQLVWGGGEADTTRRASLQVHVARLRSALGEVHGARLATGTDGGYRIELGCDQLDLLQVRAIATQAIEAERTGDRDRAFVLLYRALRLWKGPVAVDARTPALVESDVRRVEDELLLLAERWGDLGLRLGRHDPLMHHLADFVARFPARERLVRVQMAALYRSGRQGDALELFARTRGVLAERLGVDPGHELRRTFEGILRGDLEDAPPPRGRAERAPPATAPRAAPVPDQLPAPPQRFFGRRAELDALDRRVAAAPEEPGSGVGARTVRVLLSGPPGAGASALAVYWAHHAARSFPDGRLYADLRDEVDSGAVAGRFLRALGVPAPLPEATGERAALLRTVTAPLRLLTVLDNARDAAQVRPLLPGGVGCGVIVTSGVWLGDLLVRDGMAALEAGPLNEADAVDLLRERLGAGRVDAEPDGAARLAAEAGGLPLPLCMAAAWLSTRPGAGLADLASRAGARDEEAPAARMAAVLGDDPHFLIGGD